MDIIKDEKGFVFGLVITIVAVVLLVLSLLAILNHNWIMFIVFFLVACFVYPITSKIKNQFFITKVKNKKQRFQQNKDIKQQ